MRQIWFHPWPVYWGFAALDTPFNFTPGPVIDSRISYNSELTWKPHKTQHMVLMVKLWVRDTRTFHLLSQILYFSWLNHLIFFSVTKLALLLFFSAHIEKHGWQWYPNIYMLQVQHLPVSAFQWSQSSCLLSVNTPPMVKLTVVRYKFALQICQGTTTFLQVSGEWRSFQRKIRRNGSLADTSKRRLICTQDPSLPIFLHLFPHTAQVQKMIWARWGRPSLNAMGTKGLDNALA